MPQWAELQNVEDWESLNLPPSVAGERGVKGVLGFREVWRRWESMN